MMRDAKDQKMDLIICASISRFARNFSDCMTQIAALKTMHELEVELSLPVSWYLPWRGKCEVPNF